MRTFKLGYKSLLGVGFAALLFAVGCKKMDSTYQEYIQGGEIVYAQKADSLKAYPGRKRIKLSWPIGPDKKVDRAIISWNNGKNRIEHQIVRETGLDTVHLWLNDLDEGGYSIDVVTYDKYGNNSVKVNTYAVAYGADYESDLTNRRVYTATANDGKAYLDWYKHTARDAVSMEVVYIDGNNKERTTVLPIAENSLILADYKRGSIIQYRTLYVPENIAIDTFYTSYESFTPISVPKKLPNPTPITTLPGDYMLFFGGGHYGLIVDGNVSSAMETSLTATATMPQSFTLDFHVPTTFSHFKYYMVPFGATYEFNYASPEKWEIWGANDLDDDWSNWTKIRDYTAVKPSGSSIGVLTPEDINASRAGLDFDFPEGTPAYRYLRWKTTKTFGNLNVVGMAELTFWGY